MSVRTAKATATILVVVLVASGVAGAALAPAGTDGGPATGVQEGSPGPTDCAATPPEDGTDPDDDPIGWEAGYWYDESVAVTGEDGINDTEQEAIVARTMARVEAVRCIEFDEQVPVTVIGREEFRETGLPGGTVPDELRTFDNAKFEALLLVGEETDSIEVQNENRGVGVLGFYSPRRDEIVVVSDGNGSLRIDELTLAHELVHAWQDQQFDLRDDPLDVSLRDDVNARNGIVEGDASYTEVLYEQACNRSWDCLDADRPGGADRLANIGVYLLKFQPYSDGPAFVRMVQNLGGWDAVNALYEDPPASSEQVIHPQRYESDPPTRVELDDATGEGWSRVRPPDRPDYGHVGEAGLMAMFVYPYYHSGGETQVVDPAQWFNRNETGGIADLDPLGYESPYSTGWDGDRLHVYENESGETAYVWRLVWDSPQDAQQFVEGYRRVLRYWGAEEVGPTTWRIDDGEFADAFYVDVNGTTVTVVNAPTVDALTEVREGVRPVRTDGATNATG